VKVIKPQKLGLLHRVFENDGRCYFVVSIFLCSPFGAPRDLISEVALWKMVGDELMAEGGVLDEGFSKKRGEVLVTGKCFTPGGKPAAVSFVRVELGGVNKRLAVLGDRRFKLSVPTEPEPFTEMPVDWAHAYGGPGFDKNPLGKGFAPVDTEAGKVHALPNIELPGRLIVSPSDRPEPAGFSAYDLTWPQRFSKVGTYDQRWLETRFPGIAADMDLSFYNTAPPDQWIEGYFKGDEAFVVENMHPARSRLEGRLPGLACRAFIEQERPGAEPAFREIAMRIDTVRLFPHRERAVLVYRGMVEIAADDAADVRCLLIACDDPAAPRTADHYRAVMNARREKDRGGKKAISDVELMPEGLGKPPRSREDNDVAHLLPTDQPMRENMRRRQEAEREKARAELEAKGLDPAAFGLDGPPPDDPYGPLPPDDDVDAQIEYAEKVDAALAAEQKAAEEKRKQKVEETRAAYAERKLDYDALAEKARKDAAGPPKFTAVGHLAQMRDLCALAREGGAPLPELEAKLEDPEYKKELENQEAQLRRMYRTGAHRQHPVEELSREASEGTRAELLAAKIASVALPERDFCGADLSGLDLSGIDLRDVFLESANLEGTILTGANLREAVLAHARLKGTDLSGANLEGANLGGATLDGANLAKADLRGAILSLASIERTSFQGARLERAQFMEARFGKDVDLSGIQAPRIVVLRVDLQGIRLAGADLTQATFAELSLAGADLSGANLDRANFVSVNASRASFRGARLEGAQFVQETSLEEADLSEARMPKANLRGARMRAAKLGRADMTGADLSSADLTGGNLYQAKARGALFIKTNLTGAGMISIDLLSGILQKANLSGTDLTGANLFRADLAKVRVDGRTKIGQTNMKQARVLPRSKS
jgi:uncharacterized protein YjbI with pentapeptide repeats